MVDPCESPSLATLCVLEPREQAPPKKARKGEASEVAGARSTAESHHDTPPMPWKWRFDHTFQRHYPACIACNKLATDMHLDGKHHLERANGTRAGFDFPNRERLLRQGVRFLCRVEEGAILDTTPWLSADHQGL